MMRNKKRWKVVIILFPVLLLLGIVGITSIPKGSLLKASAPEPQLVDVLMEDETMALPIETKDSSIEFEVLAKEAGIYQMVYDDNSLPITYFEKEEGIPYIESSSDEFQIEGETIVVSRPSVEEVESKVEKEEESISTEASDSAELTETSQQNEQAETVERYTESGIYRVVDHRNPSKGKMYLKLSAGEKATFRGEAKSSEPQEICIQDTNDETRKQTIVRLNQTKIIDSKKDDKIEKEETESSSVQKNEKIAEEIQKTDSRDSEIYSDILNVETKATKKTLAELTSVDYTQEESLKTPVFIKKRLNKELITGEKNSSPITIRDAKLTIKTGTASFDTNDEPGNDSSATNDIVRTFDNISYLTTFSIQNTSMDNKYTDIRYRVIMEMPNAVEITNSFPQNNGEVANGTYIDTNLGDGSQISEGVMESTITDSGQIFVPIIVNVYGATNGKEIQPIIKLEIVDAKNVETEEIETFNEVYDMNTLPALKMDAIKVSAKPSVGIKLVRGESVPGKDVFDNQETTSQAFNIGTTVVLQPLQGRSTGDFRGSTFPTGEISYQIKQRGSYTLSDGIKHNLERSQYDGFVARAVAIGRNDRSQANWDKTGNVNIEKFTNPLRIPNGLTRKIYTSEPSENRNTIGVFDSGEITHSTGDYVTNFKINGYAGTLNPYTYNMTGERTQNATDKIFSSGEVIFEWDKTKTEKIGVSNNWTRFGVELYVDSISFDGYETATNSSINYSYSIPPTLGQWNGVIIAEDNIFDWEYTGNHRLIGSYDDTEIKSIDTPVGTAHVPKGANILIGNHSALSKNYITFNKNVSIVAWNNRTFEFDDQRMLSLIKDSEEVWEIHGLNENQKNSPFAKPGTFKLKYGIPKSNTFNVPSFEYTYSNTKMNSEYNWYNSYEEAMKYGKISAVQMETEYPYDIKPSQFEYYTNLLIPVKVIGNAGGVDNSGDAHVITTTTEWRNSMDEVVASLSPTGDAIRFIVPSDLKINYTPAVFSDEGNVEKAPAVTKTNYGTPRSYAESVFIEDFSITTKTEVIKSVYQTNEDIDVKVTGVMKGIDTVTFDGSLITTLPKGISYKDNSSVDANGSILSDPIITTNADGTTSLRWVFSNLSNEQRKKGIEVSFKATSDFTQLKFKDDGYTDELVVKTVGEMWMNEDPEVKDESKEMFRSSQDDFIELLTQQVVLSKKVDKHSIEVGNIDPLGGDTKVTYSVKMINNSGNVLSNAKLLDVLPYDGDSRGTSLKGNYTVESVHTNDSNSKISYTDVAVDENTNPNKVTGWKEYTKDSSIKNAKGFLVSTPSLEIGQTVELTITIQPTDQQAGDVFVNNAVMNSDLELPVNSQTVRTRVYGRDLSGVVWYDDNCDGLIGITSSGLPEEFVKDIPVKLYRSSLKDDTYKDKLVETSLTGEKFIDDSGKSLIKTDENGKYKFSNLPEGGYIAEFIIGDKVVRKQVRVTTPEVGDDPKNNSKANQETFKTPRYTLPLLSKLPEKTDTTDRTYHIDYINLGLIRPGTINLFKYEAGTAIDGNKDGELSDPEKATGTPLKGAVFDLYQGHTGTGTKLGTATTNEDGKLQFDMNSGLTENLFPGEYSLVETKAPSGFELLKKPIKVTITQGNQVIQLYQDNDARTDLPFTGGDNPMIMILLAAASLMTVGFIGMMLYYRQPKRRRHTR